MAIKKVRGRGKGGDRRRGPVKEGRRPPYFGGESCCVGCSSGVTFNLFCCFVQVLLGFLAKVIFNFD